MQGALHALKSSLYLCYLGLLIGEFGSTTMQFLSFLMVGGSATLLQFLFLIVFVELFSLNKVVSSAAGYLLSAVYNYLLNYHLTFKSQQSHSQTLPKFIVVVCIGMGVNTSIFAAMNIYLPYLLAQCLAITGALATNFLLHKFWIYRS